MALDPAALPEAAIAFLRERHLGTLTTLRPTGTPHVVPVGFAFDPDEVVVRIIAQATSRKALHVASGAPAAVCQVDGGRWLTLEGTARVVTDDDGVARAVAAYSERYQAPREARAASRVAVVITVERVMGRV